MTINKGEVALGFLQEVSSSKSPKKQKLKRPTD